MVASLPEFPFFLPLPHTCPQCEAPGAIKLQQVLKGAAVHLSWICAACSAEWAVGAGEPKFVERRQGPRDRRVRSRTERREHSEERRRTPPDRRRD